ncbi:hypothetical protein AVEN_181632-1 [Araneus ventricosus]|uniref:Uncharacterized protein n=1 Tax=Araneus ventricosus TaxID=182803 RepID=A0A4Y2CLH6_ARAVE|nr:hypothetical protein AVEN_181632-1 [Araneus ventricosus]
MTQGFVGWLQHSGETSVNDRKVKGSELDRDLSTVPTGSCNCVCVLGRYSTTRCSIGQMDYIYPDKRFQGLYSPVGLGSVVNVRNPNLLPTQPGVPE